MAQDLCSDVDSSAILFLSRFVGEARENLAHSKGQNADTTKHAAKKIVAALTEPTGQSEQSRHSGSDGPVAGGSISYEQAQVQVQGRDRPATSTAADDEPAAGCVGRALLPVRPASEILQANPQALRGATSPSQQTLKLLASKGQDTKAALLWL